MNSKFKQHERYWVKSQSSFHPSPQAPRSSKRWSTCLPSKLDSALFFSFLFFWLPHLSSHDQAGWLVGDLEHHTTIASTQLTDLLKIVILQFPHLLLLGKKGLKALPLLLIQLQLLQLLLQGLQVGPVPKGEHGSVLSPEKSTQKKRLRGRVPSTVVLPTSVHYPTQFTTDKALVSSFVK